MASDSEGPTATAISIIFAVITTIVISLRLFSRTCIVQRVGLDDVLMTIAAVLSWAFIAMTILAVQHGLGDHYDDVLARGPENFTTYLKIVWFSSIFYNASLCFIKLSVLGLYLRLGDETLNRLSMIVIAVITCQGLAFVMTCIFQCNPVNGAWGGSPNPKCVNINAFYLSNAALNILTDLITYALPARMVMNLRTTMKQKVAVGVMFGLGFFACISSIVRMTFIPKMLASKDPTAEIAKPMYWSVIEINIGILAASIPSFKPVARRYLPRIVGEYNSSGRGYPGVPGRQDFDKISARGGQWGSSVSMKPMKSGSEITTTIVANQCGGPSYLGAVSETGSGSEQSLVNLSLGRITITQSTYITQKVEELYV